MNERGPVLIAIARATIARALGIPLEADESAPWLAEIGATFVTLRCAGELRGCIGTLEACRPLVEDVKSNALGAAFHDRRFPSLRAPEWPDTQVEVSLLSSLDPLAVRDEADLLAQLRRGEDGVVVERAGRRATFLPQVWESLPEPAEFMAQLKRKAGLQPDFWSDDLKLWRYRVEKFAEH